MILIIINVDSQVSVDMIAAYCVLCCRIGWVLLVDHLMICRRMIFFKLLIILKKNVVKSLPLSFVSSQIKLIESLVCSKLDIDLNACRLSQSMGLP